MLHVKDKEPIKNMPADFFLCESSQAALSLIAQKMNLNYSPKLSKKSIASKLSVIYTDMPQIVAGHLSKAAIAALFKMAQNGFELPSYAEEAMGEGMAELVDMALSLPLKDDNEVITAYVTPKNISSKVLACACK